jgi:hypothetical protein
LNNANPALASLQVSGYRRRIHNLAKLRNKQIRHSRFIANFIPSKQRRRKETMVCNYCKLQGKSPRAPRGEAATKQTSDQLSLLKN